MQNLHLNDYRDIATIMLCVVATISIIAFWVDDWIQDRRRKARNKKREEEDARTRSAPKKA